MRTLLIAISLAGLVPLQGISQVGTTGRSGPDAFTAVALSAGGPRSRPVATNLEIVIERMSTDEERQQLLESLKRGQNAALEVMRDLPRVGYVRVPPNLAWDLRYAHRSTEDGGRRIFLATDRPISFVEEVLQPPTIEYPFTFVELRLDDSGEGEGTLTRAARVTASDDGRFVHLERWDARPVELTQVKPR